MSIRINISQTNSKYISNNELLFLYHQLKQIKKENRIMAKSKLVKANEKIAENVVSG